MSTVARHVEFTAQPGKGDELAAELSAVAEQMPGTPGCELYAVGRVEGQTDVVTVDERWRSAELRDAALTAAQDDPRIGAVRALLVTDAPPRVTDMTVVGGAGVLPPARAGFTLRNLFDSEDMAPSIGAKGMQSRFPARDLGLERTGIAHFRLDPNTRMPFGHRHAEAEETYLILAGNGRARVDDEIVALRPLDVIRVGPASVRAFEAGEGGLDLLALGPRHPGDGELLHDWWTD